ncbi:Zinc finger LIM-type protein [Dioscorea alata]|nr:Zinc finger LIM-type protein [Dioscorea alata]
MRREMLRKRSSSFFSVPGLFVGFSTKGQSDCDSAKSPTSPLDYKLFSNLRSSRSSCLDTHYPKSWDCSKVGLGLVDSLNDDCGILSGSSENRNIVFGSQMRINIPNPLKESSALDDAPKSLPKDYGIPSQTEFKPVELGKICSCSLVREGMNSSSNFSGSLPINFGSSHGLIASLSASEIELSEDYTCIISHGPNPKTTHIFGDCILESHPSVSPRLMNKDLGVGGRSSSLLKCSEDLPSHSPDDFLSYCFSCNKKLEGKDIYIYRGEKAFCSCDCREQEILIEQEMEKPVTDSSDSLSSSFHDEIFPEGMMTT